MQKPNWPSTVQVALPPSDAQSAFVVLLQSWAQ